MKNLVEYIWSYGQLSDHEKSTVEAYVAQHPEYAPALAESKAVYAQLEATTLFLEGSPSDVALAYYVAQQHMLDKPLPGLLEQAYERLKTHIETMPHVKQRYIEIEQRMGAVAAHSDPVAHFEQLTGYDVDKDFAVVEGPVLSTAAPDRPALQRPKHRFAGLRHRNSVLFVPVLLLLIGSMLYMNRIPRTAYTEPQTLLINGYTYVDRGLESFPKPVAPDIVFIFAQQVLHKAQHVWFGVYYTYDEQALDEAETLFIRVIENPHVSLFLEEESRFLLSKVYMAQGEYEKAKIQLDAVIGKESRRSQEAAALRAAL